MDDGKAIFNIELHEEAKIGPEIYVMRVPGGWVYQYINVSEGRTESTCFVPYHNEFEEA